MGDILTANEAMLENPIATQLEDRLATENVSKEISDLSKCGYQFLKENHFHEAKDAFNNILDIEKDNNYALVGLGDTERKQNNLDKAIEYYQKCLSSHPRNNYALFGLADCYKAKKKFEKAIEIWEEYLVFDKKNITVLTRVADASRKIRNFKKSREIYLKVLELEEENLYALIGLAHLHYDFKEYNCSLHYWMKVYEINQKKSTMDIRVLTSIGNCHRKLKTFDQGVPFFEKVLEMDPKNFYALFGLADCFRGMNLQPRSIEYWNRILEIDPKNKVIMTRAGDAYRNMGNFDAAREYYNKALDIDFDIYAAVGLALVSKAEGNYEDAISKLKSLLQDDPKNYRLYIDVADCYLKLGKKQDALSVLKSFQSKGIKNSSIEEMICKIKN